MKVSCYCTAANYQTKLLLNYLRLHHQSVSYYRDAIHIKLNGGDIFYFSYGCMICWNITENLIQPLLTELHEFEEEPLPSPTFEIFNYHLGSTTSISPEKDLIIIEGEDPLIMLAISFALSQSIKLVNYEESVDKTIKQMSHIPLDLAKRGKIPLSRKEISQNMGNLFIVRNSINLNIDFLGSSEFFWDNPQFEPFYVKAATYLEIHKRVEILNKRLDVINELFNMLTNELHHQYSSKLELIIILLIAIEIIMAIIIEFIK